MRLLVVIDGLFRCEILRGRGNRKGKRIEFGGHPKWCYMAEAQGFKERVGSRHRQ